MSLRRLRERIPYRSRCTQRAQLSHVLKEFVEYGGETTKEWPKLEGKNALSVIWEVLSHCPDEVPNSKDFHLRFMPDEEPLKSMLLVDFGSIEPGFPLSQWTTNLIKCVKRADGRGFGCDWGGVEVARRWVRHKIGPFSSPSIAR